jgi:hypothetical protein
MKIEKMNNVEFMNFKNTLTKQLVAGVVTVTFKKVNGSTRVMKCTTNPEVIPAPITNNNADVVTVFDVDVNDWRSFRMDRIEEVEFAS